MLTCIFCGTTCQRVSSKTQHENHCKSNPNRVARNNGRLGKKHAPDFKSGASGKASTLEGEASRIEKITEYAKAHSGGLRPRSGRGKKGWYRGFFCDSSWELAYLIYHIDHGIQIERCEEVRYYVWEGKQRRYYPDFVVDGVVVEIKGYKTKQWDAKHEANPDVICLYSGEMTSYLSYVIGKYGRDFTRLYGSATVLESGTVLKTV